MTVGQPRGGEGANSSLAPPGHWSLQEHAVSFICRKEGQVILQHSVESLRTMASQRPHRALEHPQPGQQATGRDRSSPLRLPTAQLHQQSLECLRPRGLAVLFGQASGPVPPLDLGILASKGALFVTRPTLTAYVATRDELLASADDLFGVVTMGAVKISINQTYQLRNAEQAHRDMESRQTTGSSALLV